MEEDVADEADGLNGLRCARVGEKASRIFLLQILQRYDLVVHKHPEP